MTARIERLASGVWRLPIPGSEIRADDVVGSLTTARIDLGGRCIDRIAIGIEGGEQARLVEPHVGLQPLQGIFGDEERSLHRAIVAPKANGASRGVKGS